MRVLKVWDAEYPWDVRAEKVMRSITSAGHEVHLVARNRRRDPVVEQLDEATVHRLSPWSWAGRKVDALSQFPAFMNPRWLGHMVSVGRKTGAEVVLVRDLPLTPTAIWAGRRLGIPVVLDMAENYAEMMRDIWTSGRQGPFDFVVRNPDIVARVEQWVLPRLDHVVVVVEESGHRLERLGLDADRITVVCNTPLPERIPDLSELTRDPAGDPLRLVYLGLLERPRGLGAVLDGLAALRAEGVNVTLDVIGGGMEEEAFEAQARSLGLTPDLVPFHGVLPYEEALAIFRSCHVGVVPHFAVESWNTTIPNKLFDYMAHALPVISSDAIPAARVVNDTGCGVVFESDDAEGFADAVRTLQAPEVRDRMGTAGRRAVEEQYNWALDEARLLDVLTTLAERGPRN